MSCFDANSQERCVCVCVWGGGGGGGGTRQKSLILVILTWSHLPLLTQDETPMHVSNPDKLHLLISNQTGN